MQRQTSCVILLLCCAAAAMAIPTKSASNGKAIEAFLEVKNTVSTDISFLDDISLKDEKFDKFVYYWASDTYDVCSIYPVAGSVEEQYDFNLVSTSESTSTASVSYKSSVYMKMNMLESLEYIKGSETLLQTLSSDSDSYAKIQFISADDTTSEGTISTGDSAYIYSVDLSKYLLCVQDTACDVDGAEDWSKKVCKFESDDVDGADSFIISKKVPTLVPLYRYYDAVNVDHFYTTDPDEVGAYVEGNYGTKDGFTNYVMEGIIGQCYDSEAEGTNALYRFYGFDYSNHYYTDSQSNYEDMLSTDPDSCSTFPSQSCADTWTFEKIECYVYSSAPSDVDYVTVSKYRYFETDTNDDHLFTTDSSEIVDGYLNGYEYTLKASTDFYLVEYEAEAVPLYRYYDSANVDHYYTIDTDVDSSTYTLESTLGYCYKTQVDGTSPLYVFYGHEYVNHYYGDSEANYNAMISTDADSCASFADQSCAEVWDYKGIACYVYSSAPSDVDYVTVSKYRYYETDDNSDIVNDDHLYTTDSSEIVDGYLNGYEYTVKDSSDFYLVDSSS